jgi:putative sigma-54 modulation protein
VDLKISYRHLDSSDSISSKIEEKIDHLKKYFSGKLEVHWVCSVDGHDQHKSEVQINVAGTRFHAHATDKNLYSTLDSVVAKLESQMRKKNEKLKDKIHRGSLKNKDLEEQVPSDY